MLKIAPHRHGWTGGCASRWEAAKPWLVGILVLGLGGAVRAQDLNDQLEQAMKDAVRKVAPSVVQIVTQGGADLVVPSAKGPVFRKAMGPTTGVIVGSDGFVISSAFNFVNNPTTILVAVPGHAEPYVARRIATDRSRMLTLLKIDKEGLPVPAMVPLKEIREGQWSIALGRTLDAKRDAAPSVSVGVISALGRIWGKAIQTDAKISPINYGGPMIDILGRVQGILIPASPNGQDETAGFEWYDSGIGFAIPFEDVLAVVPRLKAGKDLQKGLLGIALKTQDIYGPLPEIGQVIKDSAAARAGLKPGDTLLEIDGKPVTRMAQIQHILGRHYEGDKIALKYKRGDQVINLPVLELVGALQVNAHPFLGILPMRDDPKLGVEIRFVYPKSPAEKAGLKAGDRITKFGNDKNMMGFTGQKSGRNEFFDILNRLGPGSDITLEVARKEGGKTEKVTLILDSLAQEMPVPEKLPAQASLEKALAPLETGNPKVKPAKVEPDNRKPEKGLLQRTTATGENKYWVYVPDNYNLNISHALVIWLHPPGKNKEEDTESLTSLWSDYCEENHIIMVGPHSDGENGWVPGEADFILEAIRETTNQYTTDRSRIVAHGLGVGGQMAIYLGFNHRDLFTGVASTGAVVTSIQDNQSNQRLAFYLACGELDPLAKNVAECKGRLLEKKFPVVFRQIPNRGREYFTEGQLRELVNWIDSLDKQ